MKVLTACVAALVRLLPVDEVAAALSVTGVKAQLLTLILQEENRLRYVMVGRERRLCVIRDGDLDSAWAVLPDGDSVMITEVFAPDSDV